MIEMKVCSGNNNNDNNYNNSNNNNNNNNINFFFKLHQWLIAPKGATHTGQLNFCKRKADDRMTG